MLTTLETRPLAARDEAPQVSRAARATHSMRSHAPFALFAVGITFVLFRPWIFGGFPGGVDSAFLISVLPMYSTYGASLFTVWLAIPLGQYQQYSMYWLLAMLMLVTRSAIVTYDIASIALALGTLGVVYGFTFWLTHHRAAAAVAATLYALSPFVVSQWLSGHFDVQASIALGPLAVWMALVVIRTGSRAAALALGLCASSLFLLTTGEAAYWLLPVITISSVQMVDLMRHDRGVVVRTVRGLAIALGTFALASAVQILPLLTGAKAPFLDSSANFYVESLAVHAKYSLSFVSNVLGIPREAWLPPSIHMGAVAYNSPYYGVFVGAVLLVALSSLRTRQRTMSITLLCLALAGWLLASGPEGIFGGPYRFLYDTVPYFKFLRVPNRWLMVSTFCVAVAAGLGVTRMGGAPSLASLRDGLARLRHRWLATGVAAVGIVAACVGLAFVQVGGILVRGLPTTKVPTAYAAAYTSLRADHTDWRILTTPFYQAWMTLGGPERSLGNYETILSDLGYVSTFWTDHNVVGRGGWDPRASRFVQYLYQLTTQGSNADLAGLLGAATVKYVGVNPQGAVEVVPGQNAFFLHQRHFTLRAHAGPYTILRNQLAQPIAYVTPTFCVVAGGMGVLGDLTQDPSFSFARTGLVFADQAAATGGPAALQRLVGESNCVIEAPGGSQAMAVLTHASASTQLAGLAPGAWPRTTVSPSLDVAADPSVAVTIPPGQSLAWRPTTSAGTQRVWVHALLGPNEGSLGVRVDGRVRERIDLSRPAMLGYQWVASGPLTLAGGAHELVLTASGANRDNQVIAAALDGGPSSWQPPSRRTLVLHDVNFLDPSLYAGTAHARTIAATPWSNIGAIVQSPMPGQLNVRRLTHARTYFTLATAGIDRPMDARAPFGITFRGTGNGQEFYLNFSFAHALYPTVSFRFLDSSSGTRTIYFTPQLPSSVSALPDWPKVTGVSLSTNSKTAVTGPIQLRGPFVAGSTTRLGIDGTLPSAGRTSTPAASLVGDQRVGTAATLHGVGDGLLVFTQSYAPAWELRGVRSSTHTVAIGYANGYVITSPSSSATLSFAQASLGRAASVLSMIVWLSGLAVLAFLLVRRLVARRASGSTVDPDGDGVPPPAGT